MAVDIQEKQTKISSAGASLERVISISDADESPVVREKLSTVNDQRDMNRLGKIQQLRVSTNKSAHPKT
jgi:hypothetical protein